MSGERLNNSYEKPDWKVEREQELDRKRKIGEAAIGLAAAALVGLALMHSAKTSEIMSDEERAKNVKKIEVEGIVFSEGVNARKEPAVDNLDPNQLASIGEEGQTLVVDYNGDAYYYDNENDDKSGWYGFEAAQLSDELREGGYITQIEAGNLKSDEKYGDGVVWCSEDYVNVIKAGETEMETNWLGADETSDAGAGETS